MSWRPWCPQCGRFVSNVQAKIGGLGEPEFIEAVYADCKTHGLVEPEIEYGWTWEDFYPEPAR